ncbi:putative TRAP transporter, 4TM/12TM fusion protein [Magnetofaba australis IT-1]|uniref:Putative TRAP transporter, 4TM/12TM fusion protein n=2 Tax=Magnetofaba TaxID=1472292 RepID=A0A1Y2K2I7_9PROT|nr:putative TRAP transporter, 4TM/12TM fusion protein [Magnetofaba australis IT-1]
MAEDIEGGARHPAGLGGYIIIALALSWSLFQLWVATTPINDTLVRSIHLSFALALGFLAYPAYKTAPRHHFPWYDILLCLLGAGGAFYIFANYDAIAERPGLPLTQDIVLGVITLVLLLEAARRTLGPALTIIGSLFLAYCYFGPYMPDLLAHRGASITKIVNHMYLTTEGIFGVPLRVSASFVFLFVLFGALLERAGAGHYFIQLAYAALGRFRGGPAKAAVAASGLTGMVSGSSIANTVTTGTFTIPLMKKVGFPAEKAGAVEVAASTNGQLMPPIMGAAAFIIAEFLGISYLEVVTAAFIPAVASYMALFYVVHLEACKLGLEGIPKSELPPIWRTFISGVHYLIPVAMLIYTLVVLRQSPSLAAFNAILLVMAIIVIQRPVMALAHKESVTGALRDSFADLYHGLVNGARYMVPIGVATAAAGLVVGTITLTGLGQRILEVIEVISMGQIILVLIFTAITSLILGMGLPTTANYIVMASLTAPIIVELGTANGLVVPAIAAHLFVFYFGILADDTPPVGLAAYAASAIARSNPIKTGLQGFTYDMRTAILPFMFIFNTDIILISGIREGAFFPSAADWLWITNPFAIAGLFLLACTAMFAFASAVMGWHFGRAPWWERILLLLVVVGLFRPQLLSEQFGMEKSYWFTAPAFALYIILALYKRGWRKPTGTQSVTT